MKAYCFTTGNFEERLLASEACRRLVELSGVEAEHRIVEAAHKISWAKGELLAQEKGMVMIFDPEWWMIRQAEIPTPQSGQFLIAPEMAFMIVDTSDPKYSSGETGMATLGPEWAWGMKPAESTIALFCKETENRHAWLKGMAGGGCSQTAAQ